MADISCRIDIDAVEIGYFGLEPDKEYDVVRCSIKIREIEFEKIIETKKSVLDVFFYECYNASLNMPRAA
jgi:hypothetical protein